MASQNKLESKRVLAAIDVGTTYSGYAFSFKSEIQSDPTEVSTPNTWAAGSSALLSLKTPTTLLLNPDKSFRAFGYNAEDVYSNLAAEHCHKDYYLFRRFKMTLFSKASTSGLKRCMEIEDDTGKTMKALEVFGMAIKFLKEHLQKTLKLRENDIRESDVGYVLTVPAIWTVGSKQFMREAAKVAGIKDSNLMIALEPEAASLYCMHLPMDKMCGVGNQQPAIFSKGTKYMVIDAGDETVQIIVYAVIDENALKELTSASEKACGSNTVDREFTKFIIKIFGKDVFDKFAEKHKDDLVCLYREIENKKRIIKLDSQGKETLRIPSTLVEIFKEVKDVPFRNAVKEIEEFKGKISCTGDKIRMPADVMKEFFNKSCNTTVEHVKHLLKQKRCAGTDTILLVGGFAESPLLQEAFITHFKDMRVIIPADAGLTVLKGAVLFGHNPLTTVSRVAKYSYGVRVYRNFKEGIHPPNKRVQVGKKVKCKDIFEVHVRKGQDLLVSGPLISQRYKSLDAEQISLVFDIFISTEENPQYVTDVGSQYVGQLDVELPDTSGGNDRGVSVKMIPVYGDTEIIVEAVEERTQTSKKVCIDFLG